MTPALRTQGASARPSQYPRNAALLAPSQGHRTDILSAAANVVGKPVHGECESSPTTHRLLLFELSEALPALLLPLGLCCAGAGGGTSRAMKGQGARPVWRRVGLLRRGRIAACIWRRRVMLVGPCRRSMRRSQPGRCAVGRARHGISMMDSSGCHLPADTPKIPRKERYQMPKGIPDGWQVQLMT